FTAFVTDGAPTPGAPSGTVTFRSGDDVLGTAELEPVDDRFRATLEVEGLAAGNHQVTATYSGDGSRAASTSPSYTQVVARAASRLVAEPVLTQVMDNYSRVEATLTGLGRAPLAGQLVVFSLPSAVYPGVVHTCEVVTDNDGYARCDAPFKGPELILNNGFDVRFDGNDSYLPSYDHGAYAGN
ncbi:Ig-like domain-containing protein, partial [Nocardioides sp. GCM10030258]